MSCCGQKRASLRTQSSGALRGYSARPTSPIPAPDAGPTPEQAPALRYLGAGSLALRGPATGRAYFFAGGDAATAVHASDVEALLRTELFVRERG